AAGVVVQRVGDSVVGGVVVLGEGGDADHGPDRRVLIHRAPGRVVVEWRGDVELVDVVDPDGEDLGGAGAIRRGGLDGDVKRGPIGFPVDGAVDSHHARGAVDLEAAAGVVVQRVGDSVVGGVVVLGEGRDAHDRAHGRVLVDRVGRGVVVDRGGDVELVDVVDPDGEHLRR